MFIDGEELNLNLLSGEGGEMVVMSGKFTCQSLGRLLLCL